MGSLCTRVQRHAEASGVQCPGAGITGGYEPPFMGAGIQTGSSGRALALNHPVISPVLNEVFLFSFLVSWRQGFFTLRKVSKDTAYLTVASPIPFTMVFKLC